MTPINDTPMWLLERAAQGELDPAEVERLRVRLAAQGRTLDSELAALRSSDRDILAALPAATVVPSIRRRAASVPPPSRARSLRLPVLVAPVVLVGAAALAIVLVRGGNGELAGRGSHDPGSDEDIGIKGDIPSAPRLLVYRQKPARAEGAPGSERLADGARVARGDVLQLAYEKAPEGLYGVLLSIDGAGRVTQHLPDEANPASAPLIALREIPLPSAYELDDAPDFERFVLITRARPFAVALVLDAAHALVRQGGAARSSALPLDPSFVQTAVLLRKTGKGAP